LLPDATINVQQIPGGYTIDISIAMPKSLRMARRTVYGSLEAARAVAWADYKELKRKTVKR